MIGILYPAALFSDTFAVMEQDFVKSAISAVGKGVFFTSLFAIIIGMGISVSIAHPLQELTMATKRMAKGNFDEPLPIYSTDEIGDLARSFNEMCIRDRPYTVHTASHPVLPASWLHSCRSYDSPHE